MSYCVRVARDIGAMLGIANNILVVCEFEYIFNEELPGLPP